MPKSVKSRPKQKAKPKGKAEPETPSFASKKSYWITLTTVLAVVSAVFGVVMGISLAQTAFLVLTVVVLIGFVGFIRVTPSKLSLGKRAALLIVGASIIGFSIWAAIVLNLNSAGIMAQIVNSLGEQFFAVTSLAICLTIGAFIGELIGRNKSVQAYLGRNQE
ncbi:MAG: hypothetical protein NWE95_12720 [Candidatus Bathyarchaeota archaeon]|nr:hypothetical protein [Candidatus Bathyarchaeota archaeon]